MSKATVATADGVREIHTAEDLADAMGWSVPEAESFMSVMCGPERTPCIVMADARLPVAEPDPPTDEVLRGTILNAAEDLASSFAFYDRKEDEALSGEDPEDAIRRGVVTLDEIVAAFRGELEYLEGDS